MAQLSTRVPDVLAREIDALILVGHPGEAGYFRSRSAFLQEAARRMLGDFATRCNGLPKASSKRSASVRLLSCDDANGEART